MTDIQERLEHYEAQDRERQELADAIKECDLDLFNITRNKTEPDEEFRATYLQRGIMLRQYRKKYGQKAEEQLRDQLDEAREKFLARAQELEETADIKDPDEVEELRKQVADFYRMNNQKADQINDIKRRILDELYNFPVLELLGVLLELQKKHKKEDNEECI